MNGCTRPAWLMVLAAFLLMASPALFAAGSYVPPVVVSASSTVTATGLAWNEANVALDACGNIYAIQSPTGIVTEIPAGGGAISTVIPTDGLNYDVNNLFIDATKSNLYVTEGAGNVYQYPITNCVVQTTSKNAYSIGNLGAVSYYWSASAVAGDASGNVFIGTNVACCANVNELLEENSNSSSGAVLLGNLANPITSITLDAAGNIYYTASGGLFELPYSSGAYAAAPVTLGSGFIGAVGVSLDAAGNLFVSDQGTGGQYAINNYYPALYLSSILYEIPNEGGTLNPADQYIVFEGSGQDTPITLSSGVAVDPFGNIYYSDGTATVYKVTLGSANLGSAAVGATGSGILDAAFNSAETVGAISVVTGTGIFSNAATGTCQTASFAVGSSCTVNVNFIPTVAGVASGSVVLADATGAVLTEADLSGTGTGAGLTVDPGVVSTFSSGFGAPTGAAIDNQGNLYFADSKLNEVLEVPVGASSAAAVAIASGFNAPTGVAVDGAGNVYVADTGNNQIVEIPLVNGAFKTPSTLISSSTILAAVALNNPAGVTVDSLGNLYIADAGNKRVVYLPYVGTLDFSLAFTIGTGLTTPSAVAVDALGNVYIADAGNGNVFELLAPLNAGVQATIASNLSAPSALTVDASGSVFVVDRGNAKILRIPNEAGLLNQADAVNVIGQLNPAGTAIIQAPFGVAIDPTGNLYVSDDKNAAAYIVTRTNSTQFFGQWNTGETSGMLPYYVENSGNATLTLGTPYYTVTGDTTQFQLSTSETNACASSASVSSGSSCSLESEFAPTSSGSFSETYTLSSNAANAAAPQLTFTGSGGITLPTTTTLAVTSPSGNPSYDQAVTLTATVIVTGTTTSVGAGSVNLVNTATGIILQTAPLANGTATFTLAGGTLSGGAISLSANYLGGASGGASYEQSSSTPSTTVNVQPVATSTTLSFTTLYPTPPSQPANTAINLTATVSSTFAGVTNGSVTFAITDSGGSQVAPATVTLQPAGAGAYSATYAYTPAAPASGVAFDVISVVATYNGNADFAASSSAAGTFDVSPAIGSVSVTSSGSSISGTPVTGGQDGEGAVTFTSISYGGWEGVVGFQCDPSTLPANAICVFSPGQVSVLPNTPSNPYPPATTKLQVIVNNPPNSPLSSAIPWWLGGIAGLSLLLTRRRWMGGAWGTLSMLIAIVLLAFSASGILACGGGAQFKTPVGTTTITVYANADPYLAPPPASTVTVQPCVDPVTGAQGSTQGPCSQNTFQVSLTVQ
jgi:sugar lactone lactonase YvrE